MTAPETRYVATPGGKIAYQVIGSGPTDLVFCPSWITNLDVMWEEPSMERFLRRLASFSRLLLFDKRGSGLSDPIPLGAPPTLEESAMDLRFVLDEVGSEHASILAIEQGCWIGMLFAAAFPGRTSALVLVDPFVRMLRSDAYPWGMPRTTLQRFVDGTVARWGTGGDLDFIAPELAGDLRFRSWYSRLERASMSPGTYETLVPEDIRADIAALGIELRSGLHTGEIELRNDDVGGIAVHIGARVAAAAAGGEILVSSTVKDLVAGSGIEFVERGRIELKGVPGEWSMFVVSD